ncbi:MULTISPECIES: hypothetical protein [unclassified Legionella]|uniref:hypothetical protein n=1 Tax=unclassified Legionella TaxID=2622702 RepID=UPI00105649FC|nr:MULTISPECIES: hypothetical protein [unclassified Legionella]MDI9819041.1 hypothetical protein [Legionella sp. PL877]
MPLFFKENYAHSFTRHTLSLRTLQKKLNDKKQELEKHGQAAIAAFFSNAATDIDRVIENYQTLLMNASIIQDKRNLIREYATLISHLERIAEDPQDSKSQEFINNIQSNNASLPAKASLSRVGNALAALFWFSVGIIAVTAFLLSIAIIPEVPLLGAGLLAASTGLMTYSYIRLLDNIDELFGEKAFYQNNRLKNQDDLQLLTDMQTACGEGQKLSFPCV